MQAEEAAECERATADELLALLKEKETEVSQLRYKYVILPASMLGHCLDHHDAKGIVVTIWTRLSQPLAR